MCKKSLMILLAAALSMAIMSGCGSDAKTKEETRTITDGANRQVEIPKEVNSIVCSGVGALRYTCYMQAQDLVVGVEDCEQGKEIARGYSIVHGEEFAALPLMGANGEPYAEEIITLEPDVIMMSAYSSADPDKLQQTTGIPVVVIPGSDAMMDEGAYQTLEIMGEVYAKEERAQELTDYMDAIKKDLDTRTAKVPESAKPAVYVGGVSFKGNHGFDGTEAGYGPLAAIKARNLADTTEQTGPFNIELEQVLAWDPDVIFVDFNGLSLINEDYKTNSEYYEQLKAVKEGKVYSQISFRSNASNLEMALADTYYAASILYPEEFGDIKVDKKVSEIFETFLGEDITEELKENGYEFRSLTLGE